MHDVKYIRSLKDQLTWETWWDSEICYWVKQYEILNIYKREVLKMFSKQNLESEVREFVTEYMVKKVGRDRLIRISTFGPVERELTKEEEFKLSRELLDIIFSQKYLR